MERKKTAVELLEEVIYGKPEFSLSEAFNTAKEMEKTQIANAFEHGRITQEKAPTSINGEYYYKLEYGKEK